MVVGKERFKTKDGREITRYKLYPNKTYPNGSIFYIDTEFEHLIDGKTIRRRSNNGILEDNNRQAIVHDILRLLGRYEENAVILYKNGYKLDMTSANLTVIKKDGYVLARNSRGYGVSIQSGEVVFRPSHYECSIDLAGIERVTSEYDAVRVRNKANKYYRYGGFDFLNYRGDDLDLLDLEMTGKISSEEATLRYIDKYKDNAWYYYRYGLEKYFKKHNIPVPIFELDSNGFMRDTKTKEYLCPEEFRNEHYK